MLRRPLLLPAAALLMLGTIAVSPATADVQQSAPRAVDVQTAAAARYLGTTPERAEDFFKRQNADLDGLDRLNRLTTETDGAFFKNGEATVNVTSAQAAQLAKQLGLTPRFAVRGKRALAVLGAQASKLAGGSASAPDIARQQVVVYVESTPASKQLSGRLASLPGVRVEVTSRRAAAAADGLHYAGRAMRMYYASSGAFAWPCTQGFGGTIDGKRVMMTVGHCVEDINTVRNSDLGQAYLGWRIAGAYFIGHESSDVGLIQLSALADSYTNIDTHLGTKVVQGRRSPAQGMTICKSGAKTGWTCGDVVQHFPPYWWRYDDGLTPVKDLWSMTACIRSGDSGGPIMSGDYAIGLTSGHGLQHGATGCPVNSGRSSEVSSDPAHSALFVSIDHLRASYPGLELRHS